MTGGCGWWQADVPPVGNLQSMAEDDLDPGASTQMFQAFVDRPESEASESRWMPVALVFAALVIVLALAWLVVAS